MANRPFKTLAGLAVSVALVSGGVVLSTTAAQAVQAVDQCPAYFPSEDLAEGQAVTGLTTTNGTEPEQFTGEYVDTLTNGIAKDKDLLVFKLAGSRITKANGDVDAGIWAGMSGSPVYANDGKLIGAVSYGFSYEASDYAGVTPAKYMYDLLSFPGASAPARKSPATIKLPAGLKASVVKQGVSAKTASDGLHRLAPARFVIGATTAQTRTFAKRARFDDGGYLAGAGASAVAEDFPITAGGNFATSYSYGDIALVGVGTATAVCDEGVLAYGHPSEFSGSSTETIHGASAAFIQRDSSGGSYKLANIGAPAGSLTQDRLQGILGTFGDLPTVTTVETDTTAYGQSFHGETKVSYDDALSFVTAIQASNDTVIALNQDAGGDALVSWDIDFTRENGQTQTFTRTQRYSVAQALAWEVPNDVASDVESIAGNNFERVKINKVHITSDLSPDYKGYKIGKVEVSSKNAWRKVSNGAAIAARPGATVRLRLTFSAADLKSKVTPATKIVSWKVPSDARKSGTLKLGGNAFTYDEEEDEEFYYDEELDQYIKRYQPESFEELLGILSTPPRQDDVSTFLSVRTKWGFAKKAYGTVRAPGVVSGNFVVRLVLK